MFFKSKKYNPPVSCSVFGKLFLFVDDMAAAVVYALENELPEYLYNVGSGKDITIKELAETIQKVTGHQGEIIWDDSKPDGTPKKLMDVSKMKELGWQYSTELENGIKTDTKLMPDFNKYPEELTFDFLTGVYPKGNIICTSSVLLKK